MQEIYCTVMTEYSKPQQVDLTVGLHRAYVEPEFAMLAYDDDDDDDASICVKLCAIINIMVHNRDKTLLVLN